MKLKQAVPFVAAALLCWMPLHALGAIPPGDLFFAIDVYGINPRDQVTYHVHYVDTKGSERRTTAQALASVDPMFLLHDYERDLRIEAVVRTPFGGTKTVEYRCSKRPMHITISFSSSRSNSGCG